jgi:transposase InsO family protein
MVHPRAKLTPHGRLLLVRRVEELGWRPAQVAEASGISRATVYKWLRRFRTEGSAGLLDRSSRPHRSPRALTPAQVSRILRLRRGLKRGPHRLAGALGQARSTIYAVLRRHGCSRLRDFDRVSRRPIRYVRARAGELVHMDVKKLGVIPPGGGHRIWGRPLARRRAHDRGYNYLHVAVDDASRVAYVQVLPNEKADSIVQFVRGMRDFFAEQGVRVECLMTDQNRTYRVSRAFHQILTEFGIKHRMTRPYHPQTNGKAERFIQTLMGEWAYFRPYRNNPERLRALPRWVRFYNCRRPHTELGNQPPLVALVNKVGGNYN